MRLISVAIEGKGVSGVVKRAREIQGGYGFTAAKINGYFAHFVEILNLNKIGGTFPVPGIILKRNKLPPAKYQSQNIEFALHGYHHIDHTRLSLERHLEAIGNGVRIFQKQGLSCLGYRSPYLRWTNTTLEALRQSGFLYDSSQGIVWDVGEGSSNKAYQHVLDFYRAVSAAAYPSLPRLEKGLVRIPYSLPDDEALVNRLQINHNGDQSKIWSCILDDSYGLGELFGLGLHPERIHRCETALKETIQNAQNRSPGVWIARLDQIAQWWKARRNAEVTIQVTGEDIYEVSVDGPEGVSILVRDVDMVTPDLEWDGKHRLAAGTRISFRAPRRPFIGVSLSSSRDMVDFLKQQGYIVEYSARPQDYFVYLDRSFFQAEDERLLLANLEAGEYPLVRLGRWPGGARSALSISGDIEGYTFWDYSMRLLER